MKICVAIGGASGAIYGQRLLKKLTEVNNEDKTLEVSYIMSRNSLINWELELGRFDESAYPFKRFNNDDFMAPMASGSSKYDAMVVCPCSMGVIGRISAGISNNLTTRAADVMLKERRKLILVPRETPLSLIHLRNMTSLTEAGAIICPAIPSFYSGVKNVEEVVDTVVDRIIDLIGLEQDTYRWGEADK